MNPYVALTHEFNRGSLRAILSSGQAVVLHRLSVASKDGDWILRETDGDLAHVRGVLATHRARYRFGAPLDVRWMRGGWSAHLEFQADGLRVRTDFVTRPARIVARDLEALWNEQSTAEIPFVDARRLVEIKKTDRERDYAIIGEVARLLTDPDARMLASRSVDDLLELARHDERRCRTLLVKRTLLGHALAQDRPALEAALDAERRDLMRDNAQRIERYVTAAQAWAAQWPALDREIAEMPLAEAHERVIARARAVLPFTVEQTKA